MKVITSPLSDDQSGLSVFLAGSIEMGVAPNWQQDIINSLSDLPDDLVLMNPRRKDWDSTWEQSIEDVNFHEQVKWELSHLESANLAAFYFDPETKAPITLMELGLTVGRDEVPAVVCCPKGYWRRGNIEVVCDRHDIPLVDNLQALSLYIRREYIEDCEGWKTLIKDIQEDVRNGV